MRFEPTALAESFVIEMDLFGDDRGFFSYSFDAADFGKRGLPATIVQSNLSFNHRAGTVRGMHFQTDPHGQPKLVRCTAGAVYDVIVDLRPGSPTRGKWFGAELSADNHRSLFMPVGFAHGFQTLTDNAELLYEMFTPYVPTAGGGVRFDDPAFGIRWPLPVSVISDRDRTYADWTP